MTITEADLDARQAERIAEAEMLRAPLFPERSSLTDWGYAAVLCVSLPLLVGIVAGLLLGWL
jgi:F0F1-type ATP synthase assembly protein I